MDKKSTRFAVMLLPVILLPALGALVGISTAEGVDRWYETINRSVLTPPDPVFGYVWTALYILMGVSLGLILTEPDSQGRKKNLVALFLAQLVLNLLWSFVFFELHWLWVSALWIAVLIGLVAYLIVRLWPFQRVAAFLLVPYLLWLGFAAYLSMTIAILN